MFNYARKLLTPTAAEVVKYSVKTMEFTPDLYLLEQRPRWNIFIADDMKLGKINHKLIDGHLPVHPTCYTLKPYTVFKKDLGQNSYPLAFPEGHSFHYPSNLHPESLRIKGELYSIPFHLFSKVLDIHKQNTVQFIRKRVAITLPYRYVTGETFPSISKDHLRTIEAWMYEANPDYWSDFIGTHLGTRAVDTLEHETPKVWIDKYYEF